MHVVDRFRAHVFHVLCLPCELLFLEWNKPQKNISIIIVCEENFHNSFSWEIIFGNLCHQLFQSQDSAKSHHSNWLQCFHQLKGERLKFKNISEMGMWNYSELWQELIPDKKNFRISSTFTQLFTVNLPQLTQIWQKTAGMIIKKMKMALLWCRKIVPKITSGLLILRVNQSHPRSWSL